MQNVRYRIAMLSWESRHSIPVGGLAEHVTELAASLASRGHEVHVFTRKGEGQPARSCVDGVIYHRCEFRDEGDFLTRNRRMCDAFVRGVLRYERMSRERFDLVHGHDWLTIRALEALKRHADRPRVLTFHSTEYGRCGNAFCGGASEYIRELESQGGRLADRVICVSGALLGEVARLYQTPLTRCHVVYNGVRISRFDHPLGLSVMKKRLGIGVDDPILLFAGRLAWQKGPDLLVEAMPSVLDAYPRARFLFAGEGDLKTSLIKRSEELGTAAFSRFLGQLSGRALINLFTGADAVCVPSRNEPFGIVILEAWGARRPVVATNRGGPAEFVEHGRNGLIVEDRAEEIGEALRLILSHPEEAREMGENGRRCAEQRFSWEQIAGETEAIYRELVSPTAVPSCFRSLRERSSRTKAASQSEGGKLKGMEASSAAAHDKSGILRDVGGGVFVSEEELNRRAFDVYRSRGDAPGSPLGDWVTAETELREHYQMLSEPLASVADRAGEHTLHERPDAPIVRRQTRRKAVQASTV